VRSAVVEQRVNIMLQKVLTVPEVASITSPYTAAGARQISQNDQTAYATISWNGEFQNLNKKNVKTVIADAEAGSTKGLE